MEEEKETFEYNYSAKQQKEIKTIREKYVPKEENKMEQLRQRYKARNGCVYYCRCDRRIIVWYRNVLHHGVDGEPVHSGHRDWSGRTACDCGCLPGIYAYHEKTEGEAGPGDHETNG